MLGPGATITEPPHDMAIRWFREPESRWQSFYNLREVTSTNMLVAYCFTQFHFPKRMINIYQNCSLPTISQPIYHIQYIYIYQYINVYYSIIFTSISTELSSQDLQGVRALLSRVPRSGVRLRDGWDCGRCGAGHGRGSLGRILFLLQGWCFEEGSKRRWTVRMLKLFDEMYEIGPCEWMFEIAGGKGLQCRPMWPLRIQKQWRRHQWLWSALSPAERTTGEFRGRQISGCVVQPGFLAQQGFQLPWHK